MKKELEFTGADAKAPNPKTAKTLRLITVLLTLLAAGLTIAQLFLPALNVGEPNAAGTYVMNTYSGIDTAFICWPAFILGGELIGPNPVLIAGIVLSILLGVVLGLLLIKAGYKKSGIYSSVLAVVFLYFGICWLNLGTLVMNTAYAKFEELVYYAKQNSMYGLNTFAYVTAVAAIAAGVVNAVSAWQSFALAKAYPEKAAAKKPFTFKKSVAVCAPVMSVSMALCIAANVLMNQYAGVMNNFFGQGEVKSTGGDVSAEYYDGLLNADDYSTKEASKAFAEKANEQIVGEGVTLLKNENGSLPLAAGTKLVLLGADMNLTDALTNAGYTVENRTVAQVASGLTDNGWTDNVASADAAIVAIYRSYGEGNDAKTTAADGSRTELSLSQAELELLDNACANYSNVVVLLATSNVMETGWLTKGADYVDPNFGTEHDYSNIKGALWISSRIGDNGAAAVADILSGELNPSGRLVDTFISDFKYDPTMPNYGDFTYTNGDLGKNGYLGNPTTAAEGYTKTTFVEYEEGIYTGYRYYETAAYEAAQGNYAGFDYNEVVTYPFGYGLSYTDFTMAYDGEPAYDEATNTFTFNVKVTNTGDNAGKQVVQIYANAPYEKGMTEKAQVVLAGYAKTSQLEPGQSETVTVTVNRDYLCSYDYKNEKCYVLDAGDYNFYLSENAHSWAELAADDADHVWTWTLDTKQVYGSDNKRSSDKTAAVNQMDDITNWKFTDTAQTGTGYAVNFSRSDFAGTFPTAPTGDDYVAQDRVLNDRKKFDTEDVDTYIDDIVITDSTMTSYTLADMRGLDYDDPKWDEYIEQFSEDKLIEMYANGNWQEVADTDNGVPRTVDLDGPAGLTAQALGTDECQVYQNNILIGATWNNDMASLMGTAIANEMMAYGWTGWYGPAANIHRSAFCGRNCEYYSEDPVLSGYMSAAEVGSCAEGGVICFIKHYAVNSQEVNRQGNICTWVNEQALREVYLRVWEIYVENCTMTVNYYAPDENGDLVMTSKEMPAANGIMTSYNLIGATWAAASEATTYNILRNEWGFTGTSLTDAINNATEYMDPTAALYSGATDLCLSQVQLGDTDNDLALKNLQKAAKNVLYNKANSNCLQINALVPGTTITYGRAPWQTGLMIGWVVVAAIWVLCIGVMVNVYRKNRKGQVKAA